ncbi:Eisosome component PIL1-domain-containing protein [Radiomyces spectabilis]|uniref:Eisosome component PIL1-domain-containing protein n=1 Tax=Radiomyces spectabilis TaxID=64574 RepID=UPI0022212211|nr:Eisosome component PIL1-domain-containing protein [Radiomyces spectabilis]KAI8376055.1 Eisosome component PIL1-domain-containing protein [Radiomyces spectabilis]
MFSFNPFTHFASPAKTQEDKNLTNLLESESKVASQWLQLAHSRRVSANQLMTYGRPLGDDLTDVTTKLGNLLIQWSNIMIDFSDSYKQYQATMKTIAERESALYPSREKKRRLQESIEKLEENHPGAVDKLMDLKSQLAELEQFTEPDEVEMANFKRIAAREAFYLLLNGMHEMASKTDIVASFGKYIVDELDVTPVKSNNERRPYQGTEQTNRVVEDACQAIQDWKPDSAKVRRTLTSHHGSNPLLTRRKKRENGTEKDLPPTPLPSSETAAEHEQSVSDSEQLTANETTTADETAEEETVAEDEDIDGVDASDTVDDPSTTAEEDISGVAPSPVTSETSFYKPDDVREHETGEPSSPLPQGPVSEESHGMPRSPLLSPHSPNVGGFSPIYLGLPEHQKLYQFYQNYTPPKPYEEMAQLLSPHAVFTPAYRHHAHSNSMDSANRADPGGFVLPFQNPNNQPHHQRSTSISSNTSFHSNSAHEDHTAHSSDLALSKDTEADA